MKTLQPELSGGERRQEEVLDRPGRVIQTVLGQQFCMYPPKKGDEQDVLTMTGKVSVGSLMGPWVCNL